MKSDTALVLGNGPSVDKLDPAILPNFTIFGSNSIYLKFPEWGREADHIVMTDPWRIEAVGRAYEHFKGSLYVGDFRYIIPPVQRLRRSLGRDFVPLRQMVNRRGMIWDALSRVRRRAWLHARLINDREMGFSFETGFRMAGTVIIPAIQIAATLGFKRILLSGVDANYSPGQALYFQGLTGQRALLAENAKGVQIPARLLMEPPLVQLQIYFEEMGIELIDCTPGGKLRFITKGRLEDFA